MNLKKPEYRGMVGYLDPSSAFVGYAGAVAVNIAFGGDLGNFDPAIKSINENSKTKFQDFVKTGTPVLGICLGMEMFFEKKSICVFENLHFMI